MFGNMSQRWTVSYKSKYLFQSTSHCYFQDITNLMIEYLHFVIYYKVRYKKKQNNKNMDTFPCTIDAIYLK